MDTCRSTFSRAKKNRLDHGYRSLSYRLKYIIHKLDFLYKHVKPRKSGPRGSTGKTPSRKSTRTQPHKEASDTESHSQNAATLTTQDSDPDAQAQHLQEGSNKEDKVPKTHDDHDAYDASILDHDPIKTEVAAEGAFGAGDQSNPTTVEDALDIDPISQALEEVSN